MIRIWRPGGTFHLPLPIYITHSCFFELLIVNLQTVFEEKKDTIIYGVQSNVMKGLMIFDNMYEDIGLIIPYLNILVDYFQVFGCIVKEESILTLV